MILRASDQSIKKSHKTLHSKNTSKHQHPRIYLLRLIHRQNRQSVKPTVDKYQTLIVDSSKYNNNNNENDNNNNNNNNNNNENDNNNNNNNNNNEEAVLNREKPKFLTC